MDKAFGLRVIALVAAACFLLAAVGAALGPVASSTLLAIGLLFVAIYLIIMP